MPRTTRRKILHDGGEIDEAPRSDAGAVAGAVRRRTGRARNQTSPTGRRAPRRPEHHPGRRQRDKGASRDGMEGATALSSFGDPSTARLTSLAPQHGLAIPVLSDVETSCSYQPNSALIYRLCRVLVERGLADGALWEEAGRAAVPFVSRAVQRMLDKVGDSRLDVL